MLKYLDRVLFALVLGGLLFFYGVAVGKRELFPYGVIDQGFDAISDLRKSWKSYAEMEPTKYLQPSRKEGQGVTSADSSRAQPGLTFMTGLFGGKVGLQLVDLDGTPVHGWTPDYDKIWSEAAAMQLPPGIEYPFNEWDMSIHGAWPLPDGSVVFNYSPGFLVKLDKCSNPVWIQAYEIETHHSVFRSEDGSFWISGRKRIAEGEPTPPRIFAPFKQEEALQISPDGKILREIPLASLIIDNGMEGLLFPTGTSNPKNPHDDFLHLNDVEVLQSADAASFPLFEAGDIMVSLRNLNLIFVFDPDTLKIKWHQTGPWLRQHDPDFLPDGTIGVFNNRMGDSGADGDSDIMIIDPARGDIRIAYQGSPESPFYTAELGKHQFLPNGNILVTEAKGGRALEVNKAGEIVWEYINRFDEARVAQIEEATRYPDDYFAVEDWSCGN